MSKKAILFVLFSILFGSEGLACRLDQSCNDPHCPERRKRESSTFLGEGEPPAKRTRRSESESESQGRTSLIQEILSEVMSFQPGARKKLVEQIEIEQITLQSHLLPISEIDKIESWLFTEATSGPYKYSQRLLLDYYEATGKMDMYFSLIIRLGFELEGTRKDSFFLLLDAGHAEAKEKLSTYVKTLGYKNHPQEIKNYLIRNEAIRKDFLMPLMNALYQAEGLYQDLSGTIAEPFVGISPSQLGSLTHLDPSLNLLLGAHFLSKPETREQGKRILSWTLQKFHTPDEYKMSALAFLVMVGHEFTPMETIDVDFKNFIAPQGRILVASHCQVLDLSIFNKSIFKNVAINLDRLSDAEPDLGVHFDESTANQFRNLVKDVIKSDSMDRLSGPLSENEESEIEQKIDQAIRNFGRYLENSNPLISDRAKYVAHYLTTTENVEMRKQEIISLVNGDPRRLPGTSLQQSFNRILTTVENCRNVNRYLFHPFVDSTVRAIKWTVVRNCMLENPDSKLSSAFKTVQQPDSRLSLGIQEIIGGTIGLKRQMKLSDIDFLNDAAATFIIDTFEKALNSPSPQEWKNLLMREFFLCYTPKYLIDEFRKFANTSIDIDQLHQIFLHVNLPIEPAYIDQSIAASPQLTDEGAIQILLKYGYLAKSDVQIGLKNADL